MQHLQLQTDMSLSKGILMPWISALELSHHRHSRIRAFGQFVRHCGEPEVWHKPDCAELPFGDLTVVQKPPELWVIEKLGMSL